MYGKLYREWSLFLKERKLYSKFMMHYQIANISSITWGGRNELNFNMLNGKDYIMLNKGDSLTFSILLSCTRTIDWYLPSTVTIRWSSLATEFGELKGYIEKRDTSGYYSLYTEAITQQKAASTSYKHKTVKYQEAYGKWYDRFNGVNIRNRYRR